MSETIQPPPDMPLFGLVPEWRGPRFKGGAAITGPDVVAVSLLHGSDSERAGPQLVVETARGGDAYGGSDLRIAAEYLWRRADGKWLPDLDGEVMELLSRVHAGERSLEIDGEDVPFRIVSEDDDWVARAAYKGWSITVESRGFELESVRLRRVTDLSLYETRPHSWPEQPTPSDFFE